MKQWILVLSTSLFPTSISHASAQVMNLRGEWSFQLDAGKSGLSDRWFEKDLKDKIPSQGSTDEAGFGTRSEPDPVRLTREHRYVGPAWYQKTIEIPESWQGKRVILFLERAMWAMSLSEESQGNWNGVIGRIELKATDPVWIERVEAHPNFDQKQTRATVWVRSQVGAVSGTVEASASSGEHSQFQWHSLLARAGDHKTIPAASLNAGQIDTILRPVLPMNLKNIGGSRAAASSFNPGMKKEKMHDGAPETFWHTRYDGGFAPPPHYVMLETPAGTAVADPSYAASSGGNGHVKSYAVAVSDDGKTWELLE